MPASPREWKSFWHLTTPAEAAKYLRRKYGADALQAAEECGAVAWSDDSQKDQEFWMAVAAHLKAH